MDLQIIIGKAIAESEGRVWNMLSDEDIREYRTIAVNIITALAAAKFHIQPIK